MKNSVTEKNGGVCVHNIEFFSPRQTFDCGQCFRFEVDETSATGYAFGKRITFELVSENKLYIHPCTLSEYYEIWERYLGLDTDYRSIRDELKATRNGDVKLFEAMETGRGIRILRQDPWETLCSFIISQNNNIPRIKKLISSLCHAGAELSGDSENEFPSPQTLQKMGVEGLFALKTGFRAAYLYDAAVKVLSGEVDLNAVFGMTCAEAERELCKIKGVGPKVAACTLLFGFGKLEAFPIDVWVKRVLTEYYGGNASGEDFGRYAGLAQQYLFYHRRWQEE